MICPVYARKADQIVEVKVNSRAARRGSSPAPKDDKAKSTVTETEYKPWLHTPQGAGISKKKKSKTLTRQQRARQQSAVEKADAIGGKLEKKVADSTNRGRKVDARRADWEELNDKIAGKKAKKEAKSKVVAKELDVGAAKPMEDVVVAADFMADSMHAPRPVAQAGPAAEGMASTTGGQLSVAQTDDWEDVDEVL
jgi:ribosomal protein S13